MIIKNGASGHVETVVSMYHQMSTTHKFVSVTYAPPNADYLKDKPGTATYGEIKKWIKQTYGLSVSNLYIAKLKEKCGIHERQNYNLPKSKDSRQPNCPPEKEAAIIKAFKHFRMI